MTDAPAEIETVVDDPKVDDSPFTSVEAVPARRRNRGCDWTIDRAPGGGR